MTIKEKIVLIRAKNRQLQASEIPWDEKKARETALWKLNRDWAELDNRLNQELETLDEVISYYHVEGAIQQ